MKNIKISQKAYNMLIEELKELKTTKLELENENTKLRKRIIDNLQQNSEKLFKEKLKNDLLRKELVKIKCFVAILEKQA